MSYPIPTLAGKRRVNLVDDLNYVIRVIEKIEEQSVDHGFDEAAGSLRTTIADLHWQVEELVVENA